MITLANWLRTELGADIAPEWVVPQVFRIICTRCRRTFTSTKEGDRPCLRCLTQEEDES